MTSPGQPQLYSESVCWYNPGIAAYDRACLFLEEKKESFYSSLFTCFNNLLFVMSDINKMA
jgi:hypothetical protein